MGPIAEFGMGLGLAGVAGVRARYPLLMLGLLSRYSQELFNRKPFDVLSSTIILLLLAFLVIIDFFAGVSAEEVRGYATLKFLFRVLSGGIIFGGVFGGFSPLLGFLFGVFVAAVSFFADQRLIPFLQTVDSPVNKKELHEVLAFIVTVILVLIPLMSYVIWALLVVLTIRSREWKLQENKRYRSLR